jgi:hypothetical protein
VTQDGKGTVDMSTGHSSFQSRALFAGLDTIDSAPKLWFAVLAQAFRDLDGDIVSEGPTLYRKSQVKYCHRTAMAWFLSDSPLVGGFRWIAELFELDVQAVRKRLLSGKRISLDESFEESSPELLGESPSQCA